MSEKAFDCKMCGECCYGEGGIYLQEGEAERISHFLGIMTERFRAEYTETKHGKVYLKTSSSGYCIFYDHEKACLIHPVKPKRCVDWPFYSANMQDEDTWNLAKDACPGINRNCSFADFLKEGKHWLNEKSNK